MPDRASHTRALTRELQQRQADIAMCMTMAARAAAGRLIQSNQRVGGYCELAMQWSLVPDPLGNVREVAAY